MSAVSSENRAAEAARHVAPSWSQERGERVLSRVHRERARRATRAKLALAATGLALAAASAVLWLRPAPATPRVTAPPATPSSVPASAANGDAKTRFADGSLARVSEGGELLVRSATPERIEAVLSAGSADFEVTKHAEREFVVVAGPVRVRVVGTRFRVERIAERTRVSVSEGKVEVAEGGLLTYLEAGESRFFPSQLESPKSEPRAPGPRARFLELARRGEHKAAYVVMSEHPSSVGGTAEELMLAADAARLSNHPEVAVKYLRRVTGEHGRDSRAPLAAFTLGRLLLSQLGRPADAAEAFASSRRLRPAGGLAEDALAREAEARAASGGAARARQLAREYLSRYPQGKHAATMRRLTSAE